MDKIILSNEDIKFIFDWKEKHKDDVRQYRIPLKALKFIFSEQDITMTGVSDNNNQLTLTVNRLGTNIGKIKGEIITEGEQKGYIRIEKNTIDVLRVLSLENAAILAKKDTGKKYYDAKTIRQVANDAYTKDIITLYAATMALMVYGAEEINPENLTEAVQNNKKKKNTPAKSGKKKTNTENIVYILSKNRKTNNPVIKSKGSRAKPETSFGVRGHFRHYKNGKVIWINAYIKNKKKGTPLKDKTYRL